MEWTLRHIDDFSPTEAERTYRGLSASRKSRIDRLKNEDARRCSLLGEYLVKELLNAKYGIENAVIECAENGRPFLQDSPLFISISHSHRLVACAVDDKPVGIDIEKRKPIHPKLIDRVCCPAEKEYVLNGSNPPSDEVADEGILTRFYEIWTGKEAYFKAQGTGITDFQSVNLLTLERQVVPLGEYILQIV